MKYDKVEVVNTFTPSSVYSFGKRGVANLLGNEYSIIAFRPIESGELYISDLQMVLEASGPTNSDYPRFIVIRNRPVTVSLEDAWE